MEEAYAQALWDIVERGMQPQKAVELLHRSITARGRQGLMGGIARALQRLADRTEKAEGITLTVAREKDLHTARHKAKEAFSSVAENGHMKETVDESLIGGWRLEGKGVLVDESFKKQLMTLYNRATKN